MSEMTYQNVDRQLVEALPVLLVPHARCLAQDFDGEHPGQYNFFEPVFTTCLTILLALPIGRARDDLLRSAFNFVDLMLQCADPAVPNLARIALFEGQSTWWLARATALIGPEARTFLEGVESRWRGASRILAAPDPERDVIDLFGVREALFRALRGEVERLSEIPGVGAPYDWQRLASLYIARRKPDGSVVLSCYGTSIPYVLVPATEVACNPVALLQVARDLADRDAREPEQREKAVSACYAIPVGERVWGMRVGDYMHGRYEGTLWIAPNLIAQGLGEHIEQVLAGRQRRIPTHPDVAF